MTGWLLDTNVLSELRKTRPNRRVKEWSDAQAADAFYLSTFTIADKIMESEREVRGARFVKGPGMRVEMWVRTAPDRGHPAQPRGVPGFSR